MDEFQISKKIVLIDPQPTPEEDRDTMLVDLNYRMTLIELGVN